LVNQFIKKRLNKRFHSQLEGGGETASKQRSCREQTPRKELWEIKAEAEERGCRSNLGSWRLGAEAILDLGGWVPKQSWILEDEVIGIGELE